MLALLAGYWLLPISGQIIVLPGDEGTLPGPRFQLDPLIPRPGELVKVSVTDTQPWTFVTLTVAGEAASSAGWSQLPGGVWRWDWTFTAPAQPGYALVFYHDCHTGCIERGRIAVGRQPERVAPPTTIPTKLCMVFPNPERDWRGRSGWAVEIAYASQVEDMYWGVDDLATRVAAQHAQGLRVLIRVEYAQQQSLPPEGDYLALAEYLLFVERLARDARLRDVYGLVIGSDFNTAEANSLAGSRPATPEWYARLFNGYDEDAARDDNVVQRVRAVNPNLRVIVGPVRPWNTDGNGAERYTIDAPWLNYMHTLVARLDAGAQAKAAAGIPLCAPDGFDIQAPGRPDAPEMQGRPRAEEPRYALPRAAWGGAQAGFRIYREWLDIINSAPSTRGLPVYIISTNTYDREADIPPAQNYPRGWLTIALAEVDAEPQIQALCWFMDDFPHSEQWDWFSLTRKPGRLVDAAEEFNALLR